MDAKTKRWDNIGNNLFTCTYFLLNIYRVGYIGLQQLLVLKRERVRIQERALHVVNNCMTVSV